MLTPTPEPRRHWCQFSLRTLLAVMLIGSVGFGWLGHRFQRARDNRERLRTVEVSYAWIEERGGSYLLEMREPRSQTLLEKMFGDPGSAEDPAKEIVVSEVMFYHNPVTDADMAQLKGLMHLEVLSLCGTKVTDAGLKHLHGLTTLKNLNLRVTQITDAGLEHLKGLPNLKGLSLGYTRISDAGLAELANFERIDLEGTAVSDVGMQHLKKLTNLQVLSLEGTQVTDAGLKHLKALPNLRVLDLQLTQVTDASLEYLMGMVSLKELRLGGTNVSLDAARELFRTLNCDVYTTILSHG